MYISNEIDYLKFLKNKEVILWGCGIIGQRKFYRFQEAGIKLLAFCDNDVTKQGSYVCGLKVLSFDEVVKMINDNLMIVICSSNRHEIAIKEQLLNNNVHNFISVKQIDFAGDEDYYDESYFAWQQPIGVFGGKIKSKIFKPYIKEDMTVLEFGSGGGYLLNNINAREKVGIEINDFARKAAEGIGIKSVKHISDIPDMFADIIISTSVLEHVENPLGVLRELRNKLKDNGMIVFHVPNESCDTEYTRSEINNHLYTWNCLTLGNLFKAAGYFVYSVQKVQEVWPSHFFEIEKEVSPELFDAICKIGGRASEENRCIIVAYK